MLNIEYLQFTYVPVYLPIMSYKFEIKLHSYKYKKCQSCSHLNVVFEPIYKVSLYSHLTLGGFKFINIQHSIKTTITYVYWSFHIPIDVLLN